jgi:hypothetical protein
MATGYAARSWAAFNEGNNTKMIILLALLQIIPIFGQIVLAGVAYRWANEAAWGMEKPLPTEFGDWGKLLRSGFIVFVAELVIGLVGGIVSGILGIIPILGSLASMAISLLMMVLSPICGLRGVLYDSYSAPFEVKNIFEMMKRDTDGLFRILGFILIMSFVYGLVAGFIFSILAVCCFGSTVFTAIMTAISSADYNSLATVISSSAFISSLLVFCVLAIIVSIILFVPSVIINLLSARATGYWFQNFKPQTWGASSDPLP